MRGGITRITVLLALLALTGCKEDDHGGKYRTDSLRITLRADAGNVTKTVMEGDPADGFSTRWEKSTDRLGVYALPENAMQADAVFTVNSPFSIRDINDGVASFIGILQSGENGAVYDLYAYYPYAGSNDESNPTGVKGTIPFRQKMPANNTHDPSADYMVSLPGHKFTMPSGSEFFPVIDNFSFQYKVGFLNLGISGVAEGLSVRAEDEVRSVLLTAGRNDKPVLGGDFEMNLVDGAVVPVPAGSGANSLRVECPPGITLGELNAWAVMLPFALGAGEQICFSVFTDSHVISKSVETDDIISRTGTELFELGCGKVKRFTMALDAGCNISMIAPPSSVIFRETWGAFTGAPSVYADEGFPGLSLYGDGSKAGIVYEASDGVSIKAGAAGIITDNSCVFESGTSETLTIRGIDLCGASKVSVSFDTNRAGMELYYSFDGSEPSVHGITSVANQTNTFEVEVPHYFGPNSRLSLKFQCGYTGTSTCRMDNLVVKAAD